MLKFRISTPTTAAAPFDEAASFEALAASFREFTDACENLSVAESALKEVQDVMDSIKLAHDKISEFGCTPVTMGVFNDNHRLDQDLGLENLEMEKLATMSESALESLKNTYLTALDAAQEANDQGFIAAIKRFFQAIVDWFKKMFGSNATLIKTLNGLDEQLKNPPPDGQMKGISNTAYSAMVKAIDDIGRVATQYSQQLGGNEAFDVDLTMIKKTVEPLGLTVEGKKLSGELKEEYQGKAGTVKELGWDGGKAKSAKDDIVKKLDSAQIKGLSKSIDAAGKKAIAEAGKGTDAAKAIQANVGACISLLKYHKKLINTIAVTLLSVGRARAGKPAEGGEGGAAGGAAAGGENK